MFSKVGAEINILLQPIPFPVSSSHSTATPTMCDRLAPTLAIPVEAAGTVTVNLRNITVVTRRSCGSALNEVHDLSSST